MEPKNEKNNLAARVAGYFLEKRTVSAVFLVLVIAAGLVCFLVSPKAKDPEMEIPQFQVIFDYQGATASEVETFVTEKIESVIADIPDIKKISSVSADGGRAVVTVEFETYVNIEDAKINVLSKLNENEDIIRNAGLSSPVIKNLDANSMAILEIGFTSDKLNQNQMRSLVVDVMRELSRVSGVNNLEVRGGSKRSLQIILDPGRMQALDISATSILNAVEASNLKVPSGMVRQGDRYETIEVDGTFLEKGLAEKIIIKPGVQIKDVARVEDYYPEKTSSSQIWQEGRVQDAVYIAVAKVKGTDAITVSEDVQKALVHEMENSKYADLDYGLYRDDGEKAQEAINDLVREIMIALAAIFIVLIYFLNLRTAVTVASALPLAVMVAFVVGYASKVVVSEVALFGLIISLGLLVDSATVVVEGAYSYIQQGIDKKEAFKRVINESGMSIFIANIATIIVFVPLAMISGSVGVYIYPAIFFIIASLFGSLIMAYTMVPFIGSALIRKESEEEKEEGFLYTVRDKYADLLEKILRSRAKQKKFVLGVVIIFMLACVLPILGFVKQKSIAGGGTYKYSIFVDGPEGMDVVRTQEITDQVIRVAMQKPHVESVQSFTAEPMIPDLSSSARGSDSRNTPNVSTVKVNLDEAMPTDDFADYIAQVRESFSADEAINRIMQQENVKINVFIDPTTPTFATLFLRVQGPREEIRQEVADDLVAMFGKINGIIQIDTSVQDAFPKIVYRIDHDKALHSGVTALDAANALRSALGPYTVSQFHVRGINEPANIQLQFARNDRDRVSDLSKIFLTNTKGDSVPLDSVVVKSETRNDPNRLRYAQSAVINVTAETQKIPSIDIVKQITENLKERYVFPEGGKLASATGEGFTFALPNAEAYSINWGGETESTNDTNADLGVAMGVAFLCITLIFVVRFNSIKRALIVVSAIPYSLIGVFTAFSILYPTLGVYFTSMSIIGIIALMGIAVNNSILIIIYYEIERANGASLVDAMLDSARRRFRPKVLTVSTAVLGNVVMLFDPTWNSLAWTIICGLIVSATLVLFMIPILYSLFVTEDAV